MPTYEYKCPKCNSEFTLRQAFNDTHISNCPKCNFNTRLVLSPPIVIYKGEGFYSTDKNKDNK